MAKEEKKEYGYLMNTFYESRRFLRRCHKPDRPEYVKMGTSILIGLLCLGFSGFFIKLLSMPVNSILVGN